MFDGTVTKWAIGEMGHDDADALFKQPKPEDGTVAGQVFERMRSLVLEIESRESSRRLALAELARQTVSAETMAREGKRLYSGLSQQALRVEEAEEALNRAVGEFQKWLPVWKNCGSPTA